MGLNSTQEYIMEKLRELAKDRPEDHKSLIGELLYWGSSIAAAGIMVSQDRLIDIIEKQMVYQAEQRQITPKEYIDWVFEQENYDVMMRAFQI